MSPDLSNKSRSNLSITQLLISALLILVISLAGMVAFTVLQLNQVIAQMSDSVHRLVPQVSAVSDMELNVTRMSLQLRHAMLVRHPDDLQATLKDVEVKRERINKDLASFTANVRSAKGKDLAAKLKQAIGTFEAAGGENITLIKAGNQQAAFDHLVQTVIPIRNQLLTVLAEAHTYQEQTLAKNVTGAEEKTARTEVVLTVLSVGLALGLCLVVWVVRRVIQRRIHVATRLGHHIANGDLTVRVDAGSKDEFQPLLMELERMRVALRGIVQDVRDSTDSIATGSNEIAEGSKDLSLRTERQASSLQEASSAMVQIAANVRKAADTAADASQLAESARGAAAKGGEVVEHMSVTMSEIAGSAAKIGEITSVIDGIAFQTNILALNAAVEAARAGEQGRGFAVVASEVRILAQRSATAAKEIKALIAESASKVSQGTQYAEEVKRAIQDIESQSTEVSEMIQNISRTSQEQSRGIEQMETEVAHIDQATQQNAALVEESTAASDGLNQQARKLVSAVSVFTI